MVAPVCVLNHSQFIIYSIFNLQFGIFDYSLFISEFLIIHYSLRKLLHYSLFISIFSSLFIIHYFTSTPENSGILSTLKHSILVQLYYAIVYPFLTYGCMVWSSTYCSNVKLLEILQKRTIRIINFAEFDAHSTPLFAKLKIIKLHDTILLYTACFMYQYSNCNLPSAFDSFFTAINRRHNYSTRLASKSTFAFLKIRTNYGKFNIRYFGPKIWNEIEEQLKT